MIGTDITKEFRSGGFKRNYSIQESLDWLYPRPYKAYTLKEIINAYCECPTCLHLPLSRVPGKDKDGNPVYRVPKDQSMMGSLITMHRQKEEPVVDMFGNPESSYPRYSFLDSEYWMCVSMEFMHMLKHLVIGDGLDISGKELWEIHSDISTLPIYNTYLEISKKRGKWI